MDWLMETTSVVIVGAGFSAAVTEGGLPLMTGYFDRLKQNEFPLLYEFVREVGCNQKCKRIEEANVERVLIAVDQIKTAPARLLDGWLGRWKDKLPHIHEQLSYYTLSRLRHSLGFSPENWAANLLAAVGPNTTVISMNYDNITERILSNRSGQRHGNFLPTCPHCKMRLLLHRACSCEGRIPLDHESWRGALIKLHGSIAWRRCVNPSCCSYECLVADVRCRPFEPSGCPHCAVQCAPVLVMPTMSKNLDELPEISTMWQAARLALADAESLLLFGFSFPTSDELLTQLIHSACESSKTLKRVAAIDLEPEAVLDRFQSCLPIDHDVETVAFPVLKNEVPMWFDMAGQQVQLHTS